MNTRIKRSIVIMIVMLCCAQGLLAQSFVFSVRPEGFGISNARANDSTDNNLKGTPVDKRLAVGGFAIESGVLLSKGGLYTISVHGGIGEKDNIGVFFNLSPQFEVDSDMCRGWGFGVGFHRIPYHINVIEKNVRIDRYTDNNYLYVSSFVKLLFGSTNNLDITPKLMIGYRECNYVVEENGKNRYFYDGKSSSTYDNVVVAISLGIGYTLTTGR